GGNLTFGVPFSESDTVYFGAGLERTELETDQTSPTVYQTFVRQNGGPTRGRFQRANFEIDAIGDAKYYRMVYEHQWWKPLTRWMTLALRGEFDYGKG